MPNLNTLVTILKNKFGGEWVILYRSHYFGENNDKNIGCINVSNYNDMQNLLCACDILITDYSSAIWDYSFTGRPCFLYTPDLKKYIKERGGFYSNISSWPGILAENEEQLWKEILTYDEKKYKDKIENHHRNLGSFENGNASEMIVHIICNKGNLI